MAWIRYIAFFAAWFVAASVAHGQTATVSYQGVVTEVDDPDGLLAAQLGASISAGDSVGGSYTMPLDTVPTSSFPTPPDGIGTLHSVNQGTLTATVGNNGPFETVPSFIQIFNQRQIADTVTADIWNIFGSITPPDANGRFLVMAATFFDLQDSRVDATEAFFVNESLAGWSFVLFEIIQFDTSTIGPVRRVLRAVVGNDVVVDASAGVTVVFANVLEEGTTTVLRSDQPPPGGPSISTFSFLGDFFEITTTSQFEGLVALVLSYDETGLTADQETNLMLLHFDEAIGDWVDITSSVNADDNLITGGTSSLSTFGISLHVQSVVIDIMPFRRHNNLVMRRRHGLVGLIPVAILATDDFDAPNELDAASVTFGATGDEESLHFCMRHSVDVNRDGRRDQLCFFRAADTGFSRGEQEGFLKAVMVEGVLIGSDSVNVRIGRPFHSHHKRRP